MNQEQAVISYHDGEYIRRNLTDAQGKAIQGGSKAEGNVQKCKVQCFVQAVRDSPESRCEERCPQSLSIPQVQ